MRVTRMRLRQRQRQDNGQGTVVELKKKLKRLKKQNDKVRQALVKVVKGQTDLSEIKKILKLPRDTEAGEESEEQVDQEEELAPPVSVNESEQTPTSLALANPVVLDIIFGYMCVHELSKSCRRVCKDWNRLASSSIKKRYSHKFRQLGLPVQLQSMEAGMVYPSDVELKRIKDLYTVVETAPTDWFRSVSLTENCLSRDGFIAVLIDFGYRVKVISIVRDSCCSNILRSILVDWCPNLEELTLIGPDIDTDDHDYHEEEGIKLNLPKTLALKLTKLSVNVSSTSTCPCHTYISNALVEVVQHSRNFKTLEYHGNRVETATKLFSTLVDLPQVTDNLEKILMNAKSSYNDPLELLCQIPSMAQLKILILTDVEEKHCRALSGLLNRIIPQLTKLTLICCEATDNLPSRWNLSKLDFQRVKQMKNLQDLRYLTDQEIPMKSIDVLAKMPNLKILMLGECGYSFKQRRSGFIDNVIQTCPQLTALPHNNLTELYLFGIIRNPRTFETIRKIFPNLEKLLVGIGEPRMGTDKASRLDARGNYHEESMTEIAQIKKLKRLYLHLTNLTLQTRPLEQELSLLKNLPELASLTIRNGNVMKDLPWKIIKFEVPKLKILRLIGIKINLSDAKILKRSLSSRGIYLDREDNSGDSEMDFGINKDCLYHKVNDY